MSILKSSNTDGATFTGSAKQAATTVAGAGPAGATGSTGPQGATGPQGPEGPQGEKGAASWTSGQTLPSVTTDNNGEFFLDTDDFKIYEVAAGYWVERAYIKGDTGAQGPSGTADTWLSGTATPTTEGDIGNFYYQETSPPKIYKKVAGSPTPTWVLKATLEGPQGASGADGADGTDGTNGTNATVAVGSTPSVATGAAGSNASASISNSGTASAANLAFSFTVPRGNTGVQGEAGSDGSDGNQIFIQSSSPTANASGDFWIDSDDYNVFQWSGTAWDSKGNIKGATGAAGNDGTDGSTWLQGSGNPSSESPSGAQVGDFYLNSTSRAWFEKTASDTWTSRGSFLVNPDWDQSTTTASDYIKNKPSNITSSAGGLLSDADAVKFAAIANNANNYVHPDHSGDVTSSADGATQIGDDKITTSKVLDANITASKLASNSVTTNKIADGNVTTSKIADNHVTLDKMAGLARGKIIVGDASGDPSALALGATDKVLTSNGSDIVWGDKTTPYVHPNHSGDVTSSADGATTISDNAVTLDKMAGLARGSIIVGNSNGDPSALAAGANGKVLKSDGSDLSWADDGGGDVVKSGTPANNQVAVWTGSGEIEGDSDLVFDGSNLGIGTNPSCTLHIAAAIPEVRLSDNDDVSFAKIQASAGGLEIGADEGNNLGSSNIVFQVDNVERMKIDHEGMTILPNDEPITWGSGGENLVYGNDSRNDVQIWSGNGRTLTCDSNQNVGIGILEPVSPLHIHRTGGAYVRVTNDTTGDTTDDGLEIGLDGSSDAIIRYRDATALSKTLQLATGGYTAITIDGSQNVTFGDNKKIQFGDVGTNIQGSSSSDNIIFTTDTGERMEIGNAGVEVTGNITVTGTVDGRDVAADGTKLDGITGTNTGDEVAASSTVAGVVELATTAETTAGTDTTRAVTPAGVQAAVDDLVGGAPAALDTLNELAAAINDDDSYASTITTALALKAPKADPTFTGTVTTPDLKLTDIVNAGEDTDKFLVLDSSGNVDFRTGANIVSDIGIEAGATSNLTDAYLLSRANHTGDLSLSDNQKIYLGTGNDLAIYHDGNESLAVEGGTGGIKLTASAFDVRNAANDESMISAVEDASVTLYCNGSEKISTAAGGVSVTGDITVTGSVDGRDVAADGTKLDGIATGAEVNVQSDWDASSGDAQILNKPNVQYTSAIPDATASQTGLATTVQITKLNGIEAAADVTDAANVKAALPTLTASRFLTNDGTDLSWAEVDALPSQSGNSGKFLTTDATSASWATLPASGHDIVDESGSALTSRDNMTFKGELVAATDDGSSSTDITIDAKTSWLYG